MMASSSNSPTVSLLTGFDEPTLASGSWQRILHEGPTNSVFLTRWWQTTWWEVFGRGDLLLLGVFRGNQLIGLAPLFADGGMVFFVGSGGSDYLDLIGEIPDRVLTLILAEAAELVDGFLGFRFYHVPDASRTGIALQKAAAELGFPCYDEGEMPAPAIDFNATGEQITQKKSLVRHQRFFEREGDLSVRHFREPRDILPRLDRFFEQHIARWAVTPYPSLFLDPMQRRFYAALAESAGSSRWLRFTEVTWNANPIAFHFGFCFDTTFMWYKPSFAIELAKHSPGEVLMRNLLIAALGERARVFDLGIGAEAFKARFATHFPTVRTWGLYPPKNLSHHAAPKRP